MAKTKQQQRQKRKKIKMVNHDKQKMKEVMAKLAENKAKNQQITPKLDSISQMHLKKKNIKKQNHRKGKKQQQSDEEVSKEEVEEHRPTVNIFEVNEYQSDKPVVVKNAFDSQMDEQAGDLESKARKVMGANFSTQKFGDRPMRMIDEKEQAIVMSEDEDEKNKKIAHPLLRIPQGNHPINRTKQIEQFRKKLPIYMKEQQIVQTINTNLVSLICGQTGSGKSTQLPQFLTQKNYHSLGKIAITQPRRLATTSLAKRVAFEMNVKTGQEIAYQVRHQRKQSQKSYIKFMTDGILLKQMSSDPLLLEYSVIIIDEAHQRKINTDILIGLLSKLILLRYKMSVQNKCSPLRLVIMSATLRVKDFQNQKLFNFDVPVLNVESKMFPVTIFHEKKTPENYIDAAIKKCVKIQKSLPPGDVLIFLTGKEQIHEMFVRLQVELERSKFEQTHMDNEEDEEVMVEGQNMEVDKQSKSMTNFIIYKLYSSLPIDQQDKIFTTAPPGTRKFIISTNISETSITVPNIRYVIDSGQEKHRYFDGIWRWKKGWGSKAMAAQRAGRAGRTAHGYCYRLYSSPLYSNIMEQFPDPQIVKQPLQSILLQVKSIGFKNSYNFPFPTSPENTTIHQALQSLMQINAINGDFDEQNDQTSVTELGRVISFIPLSPRLGKMLLMGRKQHLQHYTLLCTLLLTVQSIYREKFSQKNTFGEQMSEKDMKNKMLEKRKQQNQQFTQLYSKFIQKDCGSDIITAMNISGYFMAQVFKGMNNKSKKKNLTIHEALKNESAKLELNSNTMRQFYYNCDQLIEIYQTLTDTKIDLTKYQNPRPSQVKIILDLLLLSFPKNVCHLQENNKYQNYQQQEVYIHRMSPLYKKKYLFVGCVDFFASGVGRQYMRYPFAIENYELLSTFGRVAPPSDFVWKDDELMGLAKGQIFGWQIPNLLAKQMQGQGKYFAMAKMLLQGTIFPSFSVLSKNGWLIGTASSIRPDNLDEKVQKIVNCFRTWQITSKQKLMQTAQANPKFMYKQLKLWLNVKNYDAVFQKLRNTMVHK